MTIIHHLSAVQFSLLFTIYDFHREFESFMLLCISYTLYECITFYTSWGIYVTIWVCVCVKGDPLGILFILCVTYIQYSQLHNN